MCEVDRLKHVLIVEEVRFSLVIQVQFSHAPSGGILLREVDLERWFMMYQFESNPGVMYRILVRLENDTDLASRVTVPVSFAKEGGLWKPRVATLSPRGSMLGSEGIGPDGEICYEK